MTESPDASARRPVYRSSLRSWLTLSILCTFLTFLGLVISSGGLAEFKLFPRSEGITVGHEARHGGDQEARWRGSGHGT